MRERVSRTFTRNKDDDDDDDDAGYVVVPHSSLCS
jgi:hypothetical protein